MIASYNEQLWALTLVTLMNGFVIMQVDQFLSSIGYKKIKLSIWIVTFLCIIFILLRHGVYWHYSSIIDQEYYILREFSPIKTFLRYVVLFSGMVLYTSMTIGVAIAAILTCKKAIKLKKKTAQHGDSLDCRWLSRFEKFWFNKIININKVSGKPPVTSDLGISS